MQFHTQLWQSIYSPSFYKTLREKSFAFSFKYFLKLALLLSIISVVVLWARGEMPSPTTIRSRIDQVVALYPNDLVITFQNGNATTNVKEPYAIPFPRNWQGKSAPNDKYARSLENFLVIDTTKPFTLEAFRADHTLALLSKDSIIFEGGTQGIRIFPLDKIPDNEINQTKVQGLVEHLTPYVKWIPLILTFLIFFAMFSVNTFPLLSLLLQALLIWGLLAILKQRTKYRQAYRIGLHASTLGLLLATLTSAIARPVHIPLGSTLLLLAIVFLNFLPKPTRNPEAA